MFYIRTETHDLQKTRKIKGHYRQLPNGKTVYIKEHFDKRGAAKKDADSYKGKVVHADEKSTTYVNHKGEQQVYSHNSAKEMSEDDIHDHLNSAMTFDGKTALQMWMVKHGVKDLDAFLNDLVESESSKEKPAFTNKKDAMSHLMKHRAKKGDKVQGVTQYQRELESKYGDVTTSAEAYHHDEHKDYKNYIDAIHNGDHEFDAESKDHAQMLVEHGEGAKAAQAAQIEAVEAASKMGPKDCPEIAGISSDTKFFGHQAETLAKLNVLKKAIVDVDMGGGKGLILPADAMNLMAQGKVKRPLIIATGATLEQNAKKVLEYSKNGMNVMMISNSTMKNEFEGDVDKLHKAIEEAPPNTIFMATYDVFTYMDEEEKEFAAKNDGARNYSRAQKIAAANFDYVALDESQYIKTTDTDRFKALRFISKSKYKRVATGTFLSNNPVDALGQLLFLNPQMGLNEEKFKKTYGYKEGPEGVEWTGLKQLRADLNAMGMISLRRSAWIDKLPERTEKISVSKMDKTHAAVYQAVLSDVMEQLEAEMAKNPRLRKFFDDDGIGEADELPPAALMKLGLLQSIVDHPEECAAAMEEKLETIKDAKKAKKNSPELAEAQALIESLQKMPAQTRNLIRSLKGIVSPKVGDLSKALDEHFKDKKNGKYIVFCQRKASVEHILKHLPEKYKKMAVAYDASKKENLKEFMNTESKDTPQIIVAVDASIKEGVNMQMANGMYRYDHHWSPGNQEQSYARIWRFGQDKPTKFHLGIVDGTIDVPKYARLMTKLHQNMQVVSDFDGASPPAFKMNLETIGGKNDAGMLDGFSNLNKDIIDYQKKENVPLSKKYGKSMYAKATGKQIGGSKAKQMHGFGAYVSDVDEKKLKELDDSEFDSLLGHFRDYHRKSGNDSFVYDPSLIDTYFMNIAAMVRRHKAKGGGKKLDDLTVKQFAEDFKADHGDTESLSPKELKMMAEVANAHLSGKAHTPHGKQTDVSEAIAETAVLMGLAKDAKKTMKAPEHKEAIKDTNALLSYLKNQKDGEFTYLGDGKVENPEIADKFWDSYEKKTGEKISPKYRKLLMASAAIHQEVGGGWKSIKYAFEDQLQQGEDDDEDT